MRKRSNLSKEKYNMYSSRRKGTPGSGVELNPEFKKINRFKKSLILNERKGVVTSKQDPTQLSFQFMKRK